jgi:hypothetical protein
LPTAGAQPRSLSALRFALIRTLATCGYTL